MMVTREGPRFLLSGSITEIMATLDHLEDMDVGIATLIWKDGPYAVATVHAQDDVEEVTIRLLLT